MGGGIEQQAVAGLLDGPAPFHLALAPEAQMVFEPQLDGGALTSLVVCAAVVVLFWLRVFVAITDRQKREAVEKLQKDARLKRLSGTLSEEEAAALRRAEEDQATPVLGPVGSWLRGLRLVTAPREDDDEAGGRGR